MKTRVSSKFSPKQIQWSMRQRVGQDWAITSVRQLAKIWSRRICWKFRSLETMPICLCSAPLVKSRYHPHVGQSKSKLKFNVNKWGLNPPRFFVWHQTSASAWGLIGSTKLCFSARAVTTSSGSQQRRRSTRRKRKVTMVMPSGPKMKRKFCVAKYAGKIWAVYAFMYVCIYIYTCIYVIIHTYLNVFQYCLPQWYQDIYSDITVYYRVCFILLDILLSGLESSLAWTAENCPLEFGPAWLAHILPGATLDRAGAMHAFVMLISLYYESWRLLILARRMVVGCKDRPTVKATDFPIHVSQSLQMERPKRDGHPKQILPWAASMIRALR